MDANGSNGLYDLVGISYSLKKQKKKKKRSAVSRFFLLFSHKPAVATRFVYCQVQDLSKMDQYCFYPVDDLITLLALHTFH